MMRKRPNRKSTNRQSQNSRFRPRLEVLERREVLSGFQTLAPAYVVPTAPNVEITPLVSVGDTVSDNYSANGAALPDYRMVGIPDGMGAFDNGDGTFTVLMNHELSSSVGIVRDHGSKGALVSRWVIDKETLEVLEGDDLIKQVYVWNTTTSSYEAATTAFNRLCSADFPAASAFFNPATGLGTTAWIFMNGEETSNGRSFAHVVTGPDAGTSWELPWTGKYAWENHVASPYAQDKTIVVGLDDSRREFSSEGAAEPSEVYVWVGQKQSAGLDIEQAGLVDGVLHGIRVGLPGSYDANENTVASGERFELVLLSDQTNNTTFAPLQAESIANTIIQFRRVEDGAFDPNSPNDFYFVTTDRFGSTGFSKLWRLRFDDITNPEAGGTIELLIDGNGVGSNTGYGTGEMFDNIAVDDMGRVLLQEDVGNQAHLGKVWVYDIASGAVLELARHDANLFLSSSPNYIGTQDEESSGIIDVSHILGEGTYLLDVQVHKNIAGTEPELVEMGQLLVMRVGATAGIGFDAATNAAALVVLGTGGRDSVEVVQAGSTFTVEVNDQSLGAFTSAAVDKVFAVGYNGDDNIDLSAIAMSARIFGGNGQDTLYGGAGDDWIYGGNGKDTLFGNDGDDWLFGENSADFLDGGDGLDELDGGNGPNELYNG